eukprot:TRINITY_DN9958_c0_g1_i1.p1 TRINITY_DN9958_c0_g1~~TRINITY_DN9958_c0_g1_i1.p1  ORF type:complete len:62 (-),score=0.48 TRINITY_DN9958_c0_g1_i1:230-415(-)
MFNCRSAKFPFSAHFKASEKTLQLFELDAEPHKIEDASSLWTVLVFEESALFLILSRPLSI